MIPTPLIESALALTGKKYKDFSFFYFTPDFLEVGFCYYLLSFEFIEKYTRETMKIHIGSVPFGKIVNGIVIKVGRAIYEYQSGNEQPLISLLEKIKP